MDQENMGVLGSSLGGLISCYAGWTRSSVYSKVNTYKKKGGTDENVTFFLFFSYFFLIFFVLFCLFFRRAVCLLLFGGIVKILTMLF